MDVDVLKGKWDGFLNQLIYLETKRYLPESAAHKIKRFSSSILRVCQGCLQSKRRDKTALIPHVPTNQFEPEVSYLQASDRTLTCDVHTLVTSMSGSGHLDLTALNRDTCFNTLDIREPCSSDIQLAVAAIYRPLSG